MRKHKKITISILAMVALVISFTVWWYWSKSEVPQIYGQFFPPINVRLTKSTNLSFKGKTYKNITGSDLANSIVFGGETIGQVKTYSGDGPILVYGVFGHKDLLMVTNQREEGWSAIFQEEK